jgi:predicted unusual protein kinase regulating ubiquinone biosynthesis (AarF/ABC1/UbiB family)
MKTGKTYWSIHLNSHKLKNALPRQEYLAKVKEIRKDLRQSLNNQLDYNIEADANKAYKKLPDHLKKWSYVAECTPINLGLGWC